jgi:hypothetical protein
VPQAVSGNAGMKYDKVELSQTFFANQSILLLLAAMLLKKRIFTLPHLLKA